MRSNLARRAGISTLAVGIALALAAPAQAQTSQSTLRGRAPAGATVVATEVDTGAVRQTTANANGTYEIVGLPAGSYHVTAGSKLDGDVSVAVASVAVLDLESTTGAIVVTGTRPSVEFHSSQVNQLVSLHDIAALPQVTRNFLEFADTVPGMQFTLDNNKRTSLRGGAQLNSSGNLYIDGISQKDYVGSGGGTGGSGSGFAGSGGNDGNGSQGNPFPQLAIGEYKVVTSNYSAEYGDAASAIIIAQTKSGTNKFHGEAFFDFTNQSLRARYPNETTKAKVPEKEYGVALGGPIIKDLAHFFFTWEHKSLSGTTQTVADGNVPPSVIALLPANIASEVNKTITNPFKENLFFGKIDIEPSPNDRIELTGNVRLEKTLSGGGGRNAASTRVPYKNDVKRGDLHWQHSSDHWVNEFRVSFQDALSAAQSVAAAPQFDYIYFPNPAGSANQNANSAGIVNIGGPGSGVGVINRQKGWTFADDVTFSNIQFAGEHTIKVGAAFTSIDLTTQNASADLANATYYYAVTPTGLAANATPYEVQFPNLTSGFNTTQVKTHDKQLSAYFQDSWRVNDKLELQVGLRWDHESVPAYLNYVTPANVVAALNGPFPGAPGKTYAQVLATSVPGAPAINVADYISTGSNRKAHNNFSPRIGFTYDFHGDGKLVAFGGYARSYNRNLFSTLALETTKIALNGNPQVYFPSSQTPGDFGNCITAADVGTGHCYAWDPKYLTPGGLAGLQTASNSHEVDLMNNNIKTPYSDQFSLGLRSKLGDWNAEATLSYIASYNGIYGHWGARYADGSFYQNGSQWGAQGVPGVGSLILWDNGFKDRNVQFTLAAQKPYTKESGWSATISYTFSDAKQNNAYAYGAGGNMYLFDYPIVSDYPLVRSTAVPQHRLVITGTKDLPWGIQVAGKLSLATNQYASTIYGCGPGVPGCSGPNNLNSIGGGTGGVAVLKPSGFIGYKDFDMQLTKNVTVHGITAYGRVDLINLFNWHNYDPADIQFTSAAGVPVSAKYNPTGRIVGVPFTVKFSAGLKF